MPPGDPLGPTSWPAVVCRVPIPRDFALVGAGFGVHFCGVGFGAIGAGLCGVGLGADLVLGLAMPRVRVSSSCLVALAVAGEGVLSVLAVVVVTAVVVVALVVAGV